MGVSGCPECSGSCGPWATWVWLWSEWVGSQGRQPVEEMPYKRVYKNESGPTACPQAPIPAAQVHDGHLVHDVPVAAPRRRSSGAARTERRGQGCGRWHLGVSWGPGGRAGLQGGLTVSGHAPRGPTQGASWLVRGRRTLSGSLQCPQGHRTSGHCLCGVRPLPACSLTAPRWAGSFPGTW